jgi:hypothetical protein
MMTNGVTITSFRFHRIELCGGAIIASAAQLLEAW